MLVQGNLEGESYLEGSRKVRTGHDALHGAPGEGRCQGWSEQGNLGWAEVIQMWQRVIQGSGVKRVGVQGSLSSPDHLT